MNTTKTTKPLSYAEAGVNIAAQADLVERIKGFARKTPQSGVLAGIGGFGALFELPLERYQQPVLVSGTDGVGTKLILAHQLEQHSTIGIDLVAMCANDIVCHGADPLYFLDYYATGTLNVSQASEVLSGIATGVNLAGCALVGGETAEMPGMYAGDDYDLAGFCVGAVDKAHIIAPERIREGDVLLALASSGAHANGYSLIRRIIAQQSLPSTDIMLDGQALATTLLEPTRIYVKSLQALWQQVAVHGIAHITGGGIRENLPRILPPRVTAKIDNDSWQWPSVFRWLQQQGNVSALEMQSTFNLGVGMIVAVSAQDREQSMQILRDCGEQVWQIGEVVAATKTPHELVWSP